MNKKNNDKEIDIVLSEFHSTIFKILKICRKIEPNNMDLEWLQSKLSIARDIDPLIIITTCSEYIWEYREHIITENEDFFLKSKYTEFIKEDTKDKSFMYSIINLIKNKYSEISKSEKKSLWDLIKSVLSFTVKYKKLTNY